MPNFHKKAINAKMQYPGKPGLAKSPQGKLRPMAQVAYDAKPAAKGSSPWMGKGK